MPFPLVAALPTLLASGALDAYIGGTALAGVAAYLGWENKDNISKLFGSSPSGLNTKPVTFSTTKKTAKPASSGLVPAVKPSIEAAQASSKRQAENVQSLSTTLTTAANTVKTQNEASTQAAGASKFLANQVASKASLDEVSFAVNAQSIVLSMIYETLERNLSMIATASLASAKLSSLESGEIDNVGDLPYLDSESFYDLVKSNNPDIDAYRLSNAQTVESEIVHDMAIRGKTYSEIKKSVDTFRTGYFTSSEVVRVNNSVAGVLTPVVSSPVVNVSVPAQVAPVVNIAVPAQDVPVINIDVPDYTQYMVRIANSADSAKEVYDHSRTARPIADVHGVEVVNVSPMELVAMKDAALAKGEADTNSIGATTLEQVEELFSDMDLTPDMFKNYIRFDTILNQVAADVDGDVNAWEQLMKDFFK